MPNLKQLAEVRPRSWVHPMTGKRGKGKITLAKERALERIYEKSWEEKIKKHLPDEKLLKKHAEGLEATRIIRSHVGPDISMPDYFARHKYLETAYEITGKKTHKENDEVPQLQQNILVMIDKIYGNGNNHPASD